MGNGWVVAVESSGGFFQRKRYDFLVIGILGSQVPICLKFNENVLYHGKHIIKT